MPIDHFEAQKFGRLELLAKQAVEGFITGLHKSPYHGFSVEFAEHRAYNSGESTRHIDWKLYGRTGKMFVKQYDEETNLRCQIVMDCSASMFYPKTQQSGRLNKIRSAVQSAAALIYVLRSQRDAVGLSLFGDKIHLSAPPRSSSTHHSYLFGELEKLYDQESGSSKSEVVKSLHQIAEQIHKRSLVIIFSDFLDEQSKLDENQKGLFEALQHLKHNKHEVIMFHVLDRKTEIDLDLENRPYSFIDMETGESIKLQPSDIKELYQEGKHKRLQEIKLKCRHYGIEWVETDITEGSQKVLEKFFAKRSRLL